MVLRNRGVFNSAWFWIASSLVLQYPMRLFAAGFGLNNTGGVFSPLGLLDLTVLVNVPVLVYSLRKRPGPHGNTGQKALTPWAPLVLIGLGLFFSLLASPLLGGSDSVYENHINAYGKTQYEIVANVCLLTYLNVKKTTMLPLLVLFLVWTALTNSRWTLIYFFYIAATTFKNVGYKKIGLLLGLMVGLGGSLIMWREGSSSFGTDFRTKVLASTLFSHFDSISALTAFKENRPGILAYQQTATTASLFSDILPRSLRMTEKPLTEFNSLCFPGLFAQNIILQLPLMIDLQLRFGIELAVIIYIIYFCMIVDIFNRARDLDKGTAAYCVLLFVFGSELPASGVLRMSVDLFGILLLTRALRRFGSIRKVESPLAH